MMQDTKQYPTCINTYVRSVQDAERIFHAVAQGLRHMVYRRLDEAERAELATGCVYVWEEGSSDPLQSTGQEIQRFTEGRSWGPSRAHNNFLIYHEKAPTGRSSYFNGTSGRSPELVKQTYSAHVGHGPDRRKWHLNAYYTEASRDYLYTVDHFQDLRDLRVPVGTYICARTTRSSRGSLASSPQIQHNLSTTSGSSLSSGSSAGSPEPQVLSPDEDHFTAGRWLAPLRYLEALPRRPRDPADDRLLRAFR